MKKHALIYPLTPGQMLRSWDLAPKYGRYWGDWLRNIWGLFPLAQHILFAWAYVLLALAGLVCVFWVYTGINRGQLIPELALARLNQFILEERALEHGVICLFILFLSVLPLAWSKMEQSAARNSVFSVWWFSKKAGLKERRALIQHARNRKYREIISVCRRALAKGWRPSLAPAARNLANALALSGKGGRLRRELGNSGPAGSKGLPGLLAREGRYKKFRRRWLIFAAGLLVFYGLSVALACGIPWQRLIFRPESVRTPRVMLHFNDRAYEAVVFKIADQCFADSLAVPWLPVEFLEKDRNVPVHVWLHDRAADLSDLGGYAVAMYFVNTKNIHLTKSWDACSEKSEQSGFLLHELNHHWMNRIIPAVFKDRCLAEGLAELASIEPNANLQKYRSSHFWYWYPSPKTRSHRWWGPDKFGLMLMEDFGKRPDRLKAFLRRYAKTGNKIEAFKAAYPEWGDRAPARFARYWEEQWALIGLEKKSQETADKIYCEQRKKDNAKKNAKAAARSALWAKKAGAY